MIVFDSSKRGDSQSALNDKYETAELALQQKWNRYCSRGELLQLPLLFFSCSLHVAIVGPLLFMVIYSCIFNIVSLQATCFS